MISPRRRIANRVGIVCFAFLWLPGFETLASPLIVGSKKFTESYVLAEIAKRALETGDVKVEHREGMGGTIILWEGLRGGGIQIYPEYTGTISEEILKQPAMGEKEMRAALDRLGLAMTPDLGFNNTYALVMRGDIAAKMGIRSISDLPSHPEIRYGLTHEFLDRRDGWRPLLRRYGISAKNVIGLEHALGYAGLASGEIDVKDAYSTDAKIAQNNLIVLKDDWQFFPQYRAVFLYRKEIPPVAATALNKLAATIDEARMIKLNAEAERTKNYAAAAQLYFGDSAVATPSETLAHKLTRWTLRHLELAGLSLLLAVIVGIPLGILASRGGAVGQLILGGSGIIQTIPSLALLALLVPLPFFGISVRTAIAALFLYSLLPIVRNTATGLQDIARPLRESAVVLGLTSNARLRKVYLPLASRSILSGIKTSAVINIGTATLAALIGAGGLGEPIISGLNLNDHATILQGAIPAALLAIVVQLFFEGIDRVFIPRGLRLPR